MTQVLITYNIPLMHTLNMWTVTVFCRPVYHLGNEWYFIMSVGID